MSNDTVRIPLSDPPDCSKLDASWDALVTKTDCLSQQNFNHKLELGLQNLPSDSVLRFSEPSLKSTEEEEQIDLEIHYNWQETLTPTPPSTSASSTPPPPDGRRTRHNPPSDLEQTTRKIAKRSREKDRETGDNLFKGLTA